MYYTTSHPSPVGRLTLASDGRSLTGLWIEGQKYHGNTSAEGAEVRNGIAVFDMAKSWLKRYFEGAKPDIADLPLAPAGSEFRQRVWGILRDIPYGTVCSYGEIAKKIASQYGKPCSARAVGGAVGHNPISIIIPCHRVIGANGNLTGYAGGIGTKIKLLELEGADKSALVAPKEVQTGVPAQSPHRSDAGDLCS